MIEKLAYAPIFKGPENTMNNNIKILVVDNSRLFRGLLKNVLNQYDFKAVFCSTAEEALSELKSQHYDLVCAAYHLSDMAGENFCQQARDVAGTQNTRLVLFTAEDNQNLLKQALLVGATDIYSKNQFAQFELYLQRLSADLTHNISGQILLIEDSKSQLMWMESLLIDKGLEVDSFSNAEQAKHAFIKNNYDLVISDIVLEGSMSGLSLVREIRRNPTDKGLTPIFAISAYDDISRRLELYHVGINDYMTKPVIAEEFIFRVANLIQNYRILNELSAERQHLQQIALLDPVTELYNRNAFEELAPKELAQAERTQNPLSLAILDIDHFKRVNDEFGHEKGDRVLADVGLRLKNTLRKGDMIFRWGGEEFVILLFNCPPENALELLEKQQIRFNKRKYAGLSITVSIGVSGIKDFKEQVSILQLFKEADEAVYTAKASGRNQVCLY